MWTIVTSCWNSRFHRSSGIPNPVQENWVTTRCSLQMLRLPECLHARIITTKEATAHDITAVHTVTVHMCSVEFGRVLFYPVTKVLHIDVAREMQLFYRSYEISWFNIRFPELSDVVRKRNCYYSRRSCSILAMEWWVLYIYTHTYVSCPVRYVVRGTLHLWLHPPARCLRSRTQFRRVAQWLLPYRATHHTRNGSDIGSCHMASNKEFKLQNTTVYLFCVTVFHRCR